TMIKLLVLSLKDSKKSAKEKLEALFSSKELSNLFPKEKKQILLQLSFLQEKIKILSQENIVKILSFLINEEVMYLDVLRDYQFEKQNFNIDHLNFNP